MYQNKHGRFTAVDPLLASGKSASPQTFNRYVYVMNNPLMFTDPDGLQVTTSAKGKVYINRDSGQVGIFEGKVRSGFKPLGENIETTTKIGKALYHMSVTPNGWTIGGRVDNAKFAPPAAAVSNGPPVENAAIRALATGISNGVRDGTIGILKGIGNAPVVALNGVTSGIFNGGIQGAYFQGSNPFAAPLPFAYNNAREASYGSAGSIGTIAGVGFAGSVFGASSALPSVVPEGGAFAPIKVGSAGGPTAGQRFTEAIRQEAFAENNVCVFCRGLGTEVDHVIPASRGGNATIQNAQIACRFCNASKGAGTVPKNPAPGYEGPFPPPWWP